MSSAKLCLRSTGPFWFWREPDRQDTLLTTRLAHILATRRAWPGQILAVTFTNKAAREMKGRIGDLIGGVVEGMQWLGTFHSIGARMLRRHAEPPASRRTSRYWTRTISFGSFGSWSKRRTSMKSAGRPVRWRSLIDGWKNRGLSPGDVPDGEAHAFALARDVSSIANTRNG